MRSLAIILALAAVVAAKNPNVHKVYRIVPKSEDQLKFLSDLDDNVEGVSIAYYIISYLHLYINCYFVTLVFLLEKSELGLNPNRSYGSTRET